MISSAERLFEINVREDIKTQTQRELRNKRKIQCRESTVKNAKEI